MPAWDANLYLKFGNERTQPSIDLVARIGLDAPERIIDLGCGPGNSTEILRRRWPNAKLVGLDNSPDMIASAQKAYPDATWVLDDIATWSEADGVDLAFANAALHWVPNHETLFPHLMQQLRPGGALAVQMPVHFQSPVHQAILELSRQPTWQHLLEEARGSMKVGRPAFYYDLLYPHSSRIDLWETEYDHVLASPTAIVDWIRGTGLRPYLQALPSDSDRKEFEAQLLEKITPAYPQLCDGCVLFPFRRLFILAYKK